MKRYWSICIAAMAAIFVLSACSLFDRERSAGEVVDLGTVVDAERLDKVRSDPERARKVLVRLIGDEFGTDKGLGKLKKLLESIDQGRTPDDDVPEALKGLGGFSSVQFARAFVFPDEIRKTKGLIGDFLFDKKKGSGHLTVDMKTEVFLSAQSYKKNDPDKVVILQWHIDVKKGGFTVREHSGDSFDPFPETVAFPQEALGPSGAIADRGLNHKLYAKGKTIVVRDIFRQVNDGPIVRLPNSHLFYRTTKASCIDLMTRGYPPQFRIDFPEQSGYCLGRCDHPNIVNTGM